MKASVGSEAMVRHSARSGAGQWAASLTPATPQSFTPSRVELSSGFFDIDAMITVVESPRSRWSGPTPSMILPIVDRSNSPRRLAVRSAPAVAAVRADRDVPRQAKAAARRGRRSEAWSLLGFGLAWIATTGSGAILAGKWMAPPPPVRMLADTVHPAPAPAVAVACPPPAYEPPLVSVKDLPSAPLPVAFHALGAPAARRQPLAHVASVVVPLRTLPSDRRGDATSWAGRGHVAAKSAAPRSLEDWMRGAVASPSSAY
jgi:hypothetical protein